MTCLVVGWPCCYGELGLLFAHELAISAQVSGVSSEGFGTTFAGEAAGLLAAGFLAQAGGVTDVGAGARFMVFCTSGGLTAVALTTSCAGT